VLQQALSDSASPWHSCAPSGNLAARSSCAALSDEEPRANICRYSPTDLRRARVADPARRVLRVETMPADCETGARRRHLPSSLVSTRQTISRTIWGLAMRLSAGVAKASAKRVAPCDHLVERRQAYVRRRLNADSATRLVQRLADQDQIDTDRQT
jgi:hypothetical protein